MESNGRMFDKDSFNDLKDASEVKSAVSYFSHNEVKFRQELASEGLSYEAIQQEVAAIWKAILAQCEEYKYSDYITALKKNIYSAK